MDPTKTIIDQFAAIEDPRVERTRLHSLHDVLVIALCAVIAGADGYFASCPLRSQRLLSTSEMGSPTGTEGEPP